MGYLATTKRLTIEPLSANDVSEFVAYRRDPDIARWQSWEPTYSVNDAAELIAAQPDADLPPAGSWMQLAVRDSESGSLYGDVAVHTLDEQPDTFEIGVTLASASQGRGIGTEAVSAVLGHLFVDAGAHRVISFCDSRNEPVARLLRRVGMRKESSQPEGDWFKGEWTTLDGYAILEWEYRAGMLADMRD
jgi:RimJ/RimL family protein N-acetyltransferase